MTAAHTPIHEPSPGRGARILRHAAVVWVVGAFALWLDVTRPAGGATDQAEKLAVRAGAFERVEDYWGKDLPVNKGMWNFDEIRFDSYRDITVAFESFKAGNLDYWNESSSKNWAMAYDFPAVENGEIERQEVRLERGMPRGWSRSV